MATIEQIRTDIERLDQFGKERVFAWLKTTLTPLFESKSIFHEVNERKANKGFRCIYCGMDEIVRFGKNAQDRQRYKCKCCDKTFTETADTPLYHCRKSEKWIDFLSCLIDGMSLRDSAKEISVLRHSILLET